MSTSDNFSFSLAVGGSGFFEDIDEMLALSCTCWLQEEVRKMLETYCVDRFPGFVHNCYCLY